MRSLLSAITVFKFGALVGPGFALTDKGQGWEGRRKGEIDRGVVQLLALIAYKERPAGRLHSVASLQPCRDRAQLFGAQGCVALHARDVKTQLSVSTWWSFMPQASDTRKP